MAKSSSKPKRPWTVMDWDTIQFPSVQTQPQAFTPMYLSQDFQPDPTTYNTMNQWMTMQGRQLPDQTPVSFTGMDGFKETNVIQDIAEQESLDEKFKKTYSKLAHQIAYRYPNPGLPRIRQGAIGGTWRHIKEVLGHHGSRVCFVDGLVSVYDSDRFSEALQPPLPYKGKLVQPPFAPTQDEYENSRRCRSVVFPSLDCDDKRKAKVSNNVRHKGHYQFK